MPQHNSTEVKNDIWLQNQPVGYATAILTAAYIILYVPCAIVLWQPAQRKNSCYKIMACMAILDIFNLFVGGTLTSLVSIFGISEIFLGTYINKIWGFSIALAWYFYGSLAIVLGINRCVHIKSESAANDWFGGLKIYFWFVACAIYSIPANAVLLTPLAGLPYNPKYCVFMFIGYASSIISVHNWGISIILPILHVVQYYFLRWRTSAASDQQQLSIYERRLIYQGAIICMSIALCGISYLTFPHFIDADHIWIVQLFWFWAQGGNAIIYMTMNRTIRRKVAKMFGIPIGTIAVGPAITVNSHFTTN